MRESAFQRHCSCGGITGRQAFENGIRKAYKELLKNTEGNAAAPASTQGCLGVHDLFCISSQGEFARDFKTWGETVVAAEMLSWLNDAANGECSTTGLSRRSQTFSTPKLMPRSLWQCAIKHSRCNVATGAERRE